MTTITVGLNRQAKNLLQSFSAFRGNDGGVHLFLAPAVQSLLQRSLSKLTLAFLGFLENPLRSFLILSHRLQYKLTCAQKCTCNLKYRAHSEGGLKVSLM